MLAAVLTPFFAFPPFLAPSFSPFFSRFARPGTIESVLTTVTLVLCRRTPKWVERNCALAQMTMARKRESVAAATRTHTHHAAVSTSLDDWSSRVSGCVGMSMEMAGDGSGGGGGRKGGDGVEGGGDGGEGGEGGEAGEAGGEGSGGSCSWGGKEMGDLGGVRSGTDAAPPPAPPGDGGRPNRIPGAAAMGPSAETGGSGDGTESTGSLVSVGSNGRGGGDDGGDGGGHGGQVRLNVVGRYSSSGSLMFCCTSMTSKPGKLSNFHESGLRPNACVAVHSVYEATVEGSTRATWRME
mmetsp:Transcript_3617/g.6929  ORF Transcript_3617/g.6929 Transcript_3617/m.6929 type:complete len:296 (+) Transcript_3617:455-1342(+)